MKRTLAAGVALILTAVARPAPAVVLDAGGREPLAILVLAGAGAAPRR